MATASDSRAWGGGANSVTAIASSPAHRLCGNVVERLIPRLPLAETVCAAAGTNPAPRSASLGIWPACSATSSIPEE